MTLPPVVGDAEVCPMPMDKPPGAPHVWHDEGVIWNWLAWGSGALQYKVCEGCGGRKPTDAAPSSEGRS